MKPDLECPFCDARPLDWKCMANHLLLDHEHIFKTWSNAHSNVDYATMVQCPCIATFYRGDFYAHLKAIGNLSAHFLAAALGVKEK